MLFGLSHGALVASQINKRAADAVPIVFAPRTNLLPSPTSARDTFMSRAERFGREQRPAFFFKKKIFFITFENRRERI